MKKISVGLLVLLWATPVLAQSNLLPTIEYYRAQYGTPMTPAEKAEMLNKVAWHHRAEGWGLHLKTGGTRCPAPQGVETSCDILVHSPTTGIYDVLIDHDNAAIPSFRYVSPIGTMADFVPAIAPHTAHDLVVDFGPTGTWLLIDGASYSKLHQLSPELVATGDIDGNRKDEVILDFGSQFGVWVWVNNSYWTQLHPLSPTVMVGVDTHGNGDVDSGACVFQGQGVWFYDGDNDVWTQLHGFDASLLAAADGGCHRPR
jgi:hypothetical protein